MSWFQENYGAALSNPILQSVLIIWGAVIAAKITDLIFTRIFKRVVDKTQTSLDDQILQLLHRPIFYTILFIGFSVAVKTAGLPRRRLFLLRIFVPASTSVPRTKEPRSEPVTPMLNVIV